MALESTGILAAMRVLDELPYAFSWTAPQPAFMQRTSHALATSSGVFLIDPVDEPGLDTRLERLGRVAGVIQLLDRHDRDGKTLAHRYGVPLHRVPRTAIPGAPFEVRTVLRTRFWQEVALWWAEHRMLVVAEAVGTPPYYRGPGELVGVHPLLRLVPPRMLVEFAPEHLLLGHGEGLHGPEATAALKQAVVGARRNAGPWAVSQALSRVRGKRPG